MGRKYRENWTKEESYFFNLSKHEFKHLILTKAWLIVLVVESLPLYQEFVYSLIDFQIGQTANVPLPLCYFCITGSELHHKVLKFNKLKWKVKEKMYQVNMLYTLRLHGIVYPI